MTQSDLDSAAILVVVDTPNFAGAIVQVLRNCAPFPIRAAVTNSLEQALTFLKTTQVDLILIDAFLPDSMGASSLCKLRQQTSTPAIAFARSPNEDVEHYLLKCGAQAVLPRDSFDAMMLIRAVQKTIGNLQVERPATHVINEYAAERRVISHTADVNDSDSMVLRNHIAGVARLQEILASQKRPPAPQLEKLRRLLGKYNTKQI
jgi:DNA-binding NarL/FixJ family response regulator